MDALREAAQQALAFTMRDFATMRDFQAARAVVQDALRAALAQQAEPAPGWCKHCKQYSIEEPLPAQKAEPTQTPCDIAEDGVCEVIDCCRNPPKQAEPVDQTVMELAESVGLIGPASRTHDLHGAIQRFHDLIVMNAPIKAAQQFAATLAQQAEPVTPPQPKAWLRKNGFRFLAEIEPQDDGEVPLYTAPPQRKPLTDETILKMCESVPDYDIGNSDLITFARAAIKAAEENI